MEPVTILNSDYDLFDAWLHKIYESTQSDNWFMPMADVISTGVCLRVHNGFFRVFPYETAALIPFEAAVRGLNPVVAVKVRTSAVLAAMAKTTPEDTFLQIDAGTRIQILDAIEELPLAEKDQCGAFIRNESALILWSYALEHIIPLFKEIEEKLIKYIWRTRNIARRSTPSFISAVSAAPSTSLPPSSTSILVAGTSGSTPQENSMSHPPSSFGSGGGPNEKHGSASPDAIHVDHGSEKPSVEKKPTCSGKWYSWRLQPQSRPQRDELPVGADLEKGQRRKERKLMLLGPLYAGIGGGLALYFSMGGIKVLVSEYALDGEWKRFFLVFTLPVIYCVSIFFCLQLVGNLSLIIGPVAQYHENSQYYSAVKPAPNPEIDNSLPHITIQLPVYKESLELTIGPSIFSIKKAMQTYARQGGTSAIFVCDDGLQLISEKDREERTAFYADHNIGWVARPPHDDKTPDGFRRRGKFKKASNMNYGLALSLKLETNLAQLIAEGTEDDPAGDSLEDRAMRMAAEELYAESGHKHRPWCSNGKSLRVGEIILIIDADTIVPEDCFRDAAREMGESPDVAIIQHESDVMQVAHHYFENGITHFTRRINKCISYGCANGEVAPFVGHNAFLRWSAMQDASFIDVSEEDGGGGGKRKIWSEANVSEDFDMALRLLLKGYTLRWATYSEGGFKEGVSLTVVDELNRWQKYAYGCNEIIFNPLIKWWRKGPISEQLRNFVWSKAPVHYKIGMMSYMFSYYGIAAATIGSISNYLLLGVGPEIDRFYLHSFEILLACVVVFPAVGNLGFTLLEYRLGHRGLLTAAIENVRWIPFFVFFFGGMSIHLSTALLAHLFSYNMTWGSTGKEVERSTFWIEVPRIWQRFKLSFIICFSCIIMVIIFQSRAVPYAWQIYGWDYALITPLALCVGCHLLMPIVLNPWLMIFSY